MSRCDIRPLFECQNRILNVKMRYSAPIRMSKYDFECQNAIFGQFECHNRVLNVKIRCSARFPMSKRILNVKIRYAARFQKDFE